MAAGRSTFFISASPASVHLDDASHAEGSDLDVEELDEQLDFFPGRQPKAVSPQADFWEIHQKKVSRGLKQARYQILESVKKKRTLSIGSQVAEESETLRKTGYKSPQVVKILNQLTEIIESDLEIIREVHALREVKMLSLTYDILTKLKIFEESETLRSYAEIVDFLQEVSLLQAKVTEIVNNSHENDHQTKALFSTCREELPGIENSSAFKKLLKVQLNEKYSSLRYLIGREGLYKAYTSLLFIRSKLFPIYSKLIEGQHPLCLLQDSEPIDLEQIKEVWTVQTKKFQYLNNEFPESVDDHFWRGMGLKYEIQYNMPLLLCRINDFYNSSGFTKDDFIRASMNYFEPEVHDFEVDPEKPTFDMLSFWIVLIHNGLYMTNYYGLYVTAFLHLEKHGIGAPLGALSISITPFVAMFTFPIYHYYFGNNFKAIFYLSFLFMIFGNMLYFFSRAESLNSVWWVIAGRILIGAGEVQMVSKRYLTIMVSEKFKPKYEVVLGTIVNSSKAVGPGLCGVLLIIELYFSEDSFIHETSVFSLFFVIVWVCFFIVFLLGFKSHTNLTSRRFSKIKKDARIQSENYLELVQYRARDFAQLENNRQDQLLEVDGFDGFAGIFGGVRTNLQAGSGRQGKPNLFTGGSQTH